MASVTSNAVQDIAKMNKVNIGGIKTAFTTNNSNMLTDLAAGDPDSAINKVLSKISSDQSSAGISNWSLSNMFNTGLKTNIIDQFKPNSNNNKLLQMTKLIQRQTYINNRLKFYVNQYKSLTKKKIQLKK